MQEKEVNAIYVKDSEYLREYVYRNGLYAIMVIKSLGGPVLREERFI